MTINFNVLALLALLATAIHWLFARSAIMKWFWDLRWWPTTQGKVYSSTGVIGRVDGSAPTWNNALRELFSGLLACTACAGFWLGIGAGLLHIWPLALGPGWLNVLGSGLAGIVTVPILEGALIWGLNTTRID